MGLEEAGQCDSDSEPPEERRSLRDRSLSAEAVGLTVLRFLFALFMTLFRAGGRSASEEGGQVERGSHGNSLRVV